MSTQLDFKISSGLKNIIGKELITNDRIAIFELVKNSYDANARKVRIVFQNIKSAAKNKTSKILIIDDGDGMSYKELVSKWLFVGYSDKRVLEKGLKANYRYKINHRRYFAGAKGVGRFSCDRLGAKLRVYTKKVNESQIHSLDVDWTRFEKDQKKEFQTIKVKYGRSSRINIGNCPIHKFMKGTILEISSLHDAWDKTKLLDLRKYLQRLINPSLGDEDQKFKISLQATEYLEDDKRLKEKEEHNRINGPIRNIIIEKLNIKTTQIKSSISNGKMTIELIDKGKFIFSLEEKNIYSNLDNITVNLFYLNHAAKTSFTRTMGVEPKNYGSVFLYKNKFRIHPYGDEGNDWLELEKRKGQGYARYLATRELLGRIELHGSQPFFIEASSRDGGVIMTEALKELHSYFINKVLRRLERYVVEGIDWDKEDNWQLKSQKDIKRDSLKLIERFIGQIKDPEKNIKLNPELLTILKDKQIENLPQVIKNVESLKKYVKTSKERDYIDKQLKSVIIATKNLELDRKETAKELEVQKRESLFLSKVISTDKDIINCLYHTIENSTQTINEIILDINEKIKRNSPIREIAPLIDELSLENDKIKVLAGIVNLANFNTKVELIKNDVVLYVKEYLQKIVKAEIMKFRFFNKNIKHVIKFRPLEISIVLDNFISNAKKAGATSMAIKFKMKSERLHIYISDNGKGVDKKMLNRLFRRGETTTSGSGLGLHHIKTIIERMGGSVIFAGNNIKELGKGACFKVVLP